MLGAAVGPVEPDAQRLHARGGEIDREPDAVGQDVAARDQEDVLHLLGDRPGHALRRGFEQEIDHRLGDVAHVEEAATAVRKIRNGKIAISEVSATWLAMAQPSVRVKRSTARQTIAKERRSFLDASPASMDTACSIAATSPRVSDVLSVTLTKDALRSREA